MSGEVWRAWPPPAVTVEALRGLEYVVVDVETTGGSAARGHRITEIAALRVDGSGRVADEFCTLVNPQRPIPPFITRLTKITDEMVRDAPRFDEIAPDVTRLLRGRVFVAHNARFDWGFVCAELARSTGIWPDCRTLCTLRLARRLVPEVSSRSLDSLADYFGIENAARHRAYGDAQATVALLGRLLERVEDREIGSWAELEALLTRRAPRRKRSALPQPMDDVV